MVLAIGVLTRQIVDLIEGRSDPGGISIKSVTVENATNILRNKGWIANPQNYPTEKVTKLIKKILTRDRKVSKLIKKYRQGTEKYPKNMNQDSGPLKKSIKKTKNA